MAPPKPTPEQIRGALKTKLTNFAKFVSDNYEKEAITELDIIQLESRLDKVLKLEDEFDEVQLAIESGVQSEAEREEQAKERNEFENKFYEQTSLAKMLIKSNTREKSEETPQSREDSSPPPGDEPTDTNTENNNKNKPSNLGIRLPIIELPKFSGDYSSWLEFRDTFESLIHKNEQINNIQKFHYLRSALVGDAINVIASLEFSLHNYSVAWNALLERYDNRNLLIHNHIKALFNIEPLQKESSGGLRKIVDSVSKHMRALQQLKEPTNNWDTPIVYVISTKLDTTTLGEWEKYKKSVSVYTLELLKTFLKSRADLLETLELRKQEKVADKEKVKRDTGQKQSRGFLATESGKQVNRFFAKCRFCSKQHYIQNCSEFLKLAPDEKREKLQSLKLCENCMRPGHANEACRRGTCQKCGDKHHTLLHKETVSANSTSVNISSVVLANSSENDKSSANGYVVLSTAFVQILDAQNNTFVVRALLDAGSQSNYITQALCEKLSLNTSKQEIIISGLNNSVSKVNKKCDVVIQGLHNNFSASISCFVIPQITENMPNIKLNISALNIPTNIKLADPSFYQPQKVDLLIGAELFWNLLCIGQISLGHNKPVLQKTRLGWIVAGTLPQERPPRTSCNFGQQLDIQAQLSRFWELEECSPNRPLTQEEKDCEEHFLKNTKRDPDGRFIVALPLKDSEEKLGDSYTQARRRLLLLERKLQSKPEVKDEYSKFMDEYLELGHMSKIQSNLGANSQSYCDEKATYYMPHRCVLREDNITTKLRVVFDASAPSSSGYSLNHLQMTGPVIQCELFSILIRFRQHKYVVSGDVEKMYRQVLITPEQRPLQRILWRNNTEQEIEVFELNTVTYGTTAASYLAVRCLYQLAEENKVKNPQLSRVIAEDFYVDDCLTGSNSVEETSFIIRGVTDILKQGCFNLRKFYSNNPEVLKHFSNSGTHVNIIEFGENENAKTLGLSWRPTSDELLYKLNTAPENQKVNKRTILSAVSQIFDPLGLLSPCVITAKILLQDLWLEKLTWDEGLPSNMHTFWCDFRNELSELNDLRIKRYVLCDNPKQVEIHAFSDASQKAYGACVFLRSIDQDQNITVNLLCAKTKVAPLKTVTLPRLELSGALVSARLVDKVSKSLRLKIERRYFWTDSTIVLGWLKMPPNKLKTFVSNRVAEIQNITSADLWQHCKSKENPADILSRGLRPREMRNLKLWWHGPSWLSQTSNHWLKSNVSKTPENLPDVKRTAQSFISYQTSQFPFEKFSDLTKLQRVTGWILRFKANCQTKQKSVGPMTLQELENALKTLIKLAQQSSFAQELHCLENDQPIHRKSRILNLNPFIDSEGVLRVGGRLQNSKFSEHKKHPILLCSKHHLTLLIFRDEHVRLLHTGPQHLLASLRERFWPVLGRNLANKVVNRCISCYRHKPKTIQPIMGQLPEPRLHPGPPFNTTGLDYGGPLLIKNRKGRGAKLEKCYIGLFICFATKAVHLELISDLSKDSFIMALKRFVSRRGKPARIFSDNGTNFVAANKELKILGEFLNKSSQELTDHFIQDGIDWKFIPPYSPHFGGLWEAGIKASKNLLKRVLGEAHLTFEELNTLLVQVEAVLNSRPLCPLSSNPHDFSPLTPAHFLVGRPLTAIPENDLRGIPVNRLSRLQHMQQCQQHFWRRWKLEYIADLQKRAKWTKTKGQLSIGDVVLLKDDNSPPLCWKLGRVIQLHPGTDGVSRVATVKTSKGDVKRSYAKLCPLPQEDGAIKEPK